MLHVTAVAGYHARMLELTADNTAPYLRERSLVGPGPIHVAELADGVSNAVLRVETAERTVILKQSRPQLRTREAWFSDVARIWRERDVMRFLHPRLPVETVPEVLFDDEANFVFAMSCAPQPHRNWRSMLLAGEVDAQLGKLAGRLLALIHQPAHGLEPFADRTVFEQLRVEPFYLRIQQRLPDIAAEIEPLVQRCRTQRLGLCHGDFSPKNLLVHATGFTLVDYETAHWGDVTFDLGFFVSHLLLKSIHLPERLNDVHQLIRSFWDGYSAESSGLLEETARIGIQHAAACLLARVDGTSPAPYLSDDHQRDRVRRLGRSLLQRKPGSWDDVLSLAAK